MSLHPPLAAGGRDVWWRARRHSTQPPAFDCPASPRRPPPASQGHSALLSTATCRPCPQPSAACDSPREASAMMLGPTNSATRAAAAEAHADHAEAALAVCLQQPSFRGPDVRVAIRLLAVSKRLAALVARCCGGALALHTQLDKAAHADALVAWLSHHGALLAEMKVDLYCCDQAEQAHRAVCVLEQLPSSLTHLTLKGWDAAAFAAQQAAAFVRALSRQSMQLRSLGLPDSWRDQAATVLPALAALCRLTSLVMWVPGDDLSQLPMQQIPAQLQQLELLGIRLHATAALPWLALEHVTGLTRLILLACVDGGVLPRGLRSLAVADVSNTATLQPLEQLTALQLRDYNSDITSAEQLRQLSTLRRLEQLSVTAYGCFRAGALSDALAALAVLPLRHLNVSNANLTAACLARLGDCTRLTSLELLSFHLADGATPEQLAAAVARLTALECVQLRNKDVPPADAAGWWAPVCKALVQLPRLTACQLELPGLGAAAAHLAAATQLTELLVCKGGLDDGCLGTICTGLTALRHLDVSANRLLTDACLACVAAMPRLMLLDLRYTRVTDDGVQQLCAARPSLQVQRP